MTNDVGHLFAYVLDGTGGGKRLDKKGLQSWSADLGVMWIHLDYSGADAIAWLNKKSRFDPIILEALIAEETRPRTFSHKKGLLAIFRGVNLNPGHDPEDMVSLRMWIEKDRIITLRRRRIMAVDDLRIALENGDGPKDPGGFLEMITDRLVERMSKVIGDVEDAADALEDEVLTAQTYQLRPKISSIRRTAIGLRRYLAPQRDAMNRLYNENLSWISEMNKMRLREIADRTTRFIEDLDNIRERATVTQEELNNHLSEKMNRTMYMLSIVTGIFLPLGLLTGLLGINVGGMPGVDSSYAFTIVCILLVVLAMGQIWFFKRQKLM